MQLFINSVPLHSFGRLVVRNQSATMDPPEAPVRQRVTLQVQIKTVEPTWADNQDLIRQLRAALKSQDPVLLWRNENGAVVLNQTVTVGDHNLPEEFAWGTRMQGLEVSFTYFDNSLSSENLGCTYQRMGDNRPLLSLGSVLKTKERYTSVRVSPQRSDRVRDGGQITVTGKALPNALLSVAQRRAYLEGLQAQWRSELAAGKEGTLIYGGFNQVVRVEEFDADIDQIKDEINWILTASYTRFPDEEDYATAEFTVKRRTDQESGQVFLTLAGKVGAATKLQALAKLDTLRAQFVTSGFVRLRQELGEGRYNVDDGEDFLELSFEEEYQQAVSAILRWALRVTDAEDTKTGLSRRTYTGSVTAHASTYATAYAAAVAKARALGDNRHQFKVSGTITDEDRQTVTPAPRLVTVDFAFEYQVKASRIYLEVNSETVTAMTEENAEQVSGFVVAEDLTAARDVYTSLVRGPLTGRLIRSERLAENRQTIQQANLANGALLSGQYVTQQLRLDFAITLHKEKADAEVGIKYAMEVRRNFRTLEKFTTVSGKVYARDAETVTNGGLFRTSGKKIQAEAALDQFLATLGLGTPVEDTRSDEVEFFMGNVGSTLDDVRRSICLNFSASYEGRITGSGQVMEFELSEDLEHSGTRWVVQGIPDGRDVVQNCGTQSGRRTVSGSVTAATEAAAMTWARSQRARLEGEYELPPKFNVGRVFVPLSAGQEDDVRMYKVGFTFGEILPDKDYQP